MLLFSYQFQVYMLSLICENLLCVHLYMSSIKQPLSFIIWSIIFLMFWHPKDSKYFSLVYTHKSRDSFDTRMVMGCSLQPHNN